MGRRYLGALGARVGLLLLLLSGWGPASAQGPVSLDSLEIALWPEYDRQAVLVIYRGRVSGETALPVTLRFRVPKSAGDLGGTAGVDAQGGFHYYRPTISDLGDVLEVTYTIPYRAFQFEYYDGGPQVQGEDRSLAFTYRADYNTGSLVFLAQEPAGSSGFATSPEGVLADDPLGSGLKVRRWAIGPAREGETFEWEVRYRKADPRLSAEILGLPTPGTSAYEDAAPTDGTQRSLLIAAGIGVVVLACLLGFYFGVVRRRKVPRTAEPPRRKPKKRARKPAEVAAGTDLARFCHQCGYRWEEGDVFCPQCGARRKGA